MSDQTLIQVRMDSILKDQAFEVFDKMGIDMSTAVRMFFKATVRQQQLPFSTNVADTKEESKTREMKEQYMNMLMYEPPTADDKDIVTMLPLQYGEIPISMFVQLITKIPAGNVSRWEDIFEYLGKLYGMKIYEMPKKSIPAIDSDGNDIPYWRLISSNGVLGIGKWLSREGQKERLEKEGIPVIQRGKIEGSYRVDNYKDYLFDFHTLNVVRTE